MGFQLLHWVIILSKTKELLARQVNDYISCILLTIDSKTKFLDFSEDWLDEKNFFLLKFLAEYLQSYGIKEENPLAQCFIIFILLFFCQPTHAGALFYCINQDKNVAIYLTLLRA